MGPHFINMKAPATFHLYSNRVYSCENCVAWLKRKTSRSSSWSGVVQIPHSLPDFPDESFLALSSRFRGGRAGGSMQQSVDNSVSPAKKMERHCRWHT